MLWKLKYKPWNFESIVSNVKMLRLSATYPAFSLTSQRNMFSLWVVYINFIVAFCFLLLLISSSQSDFKENSHRNFIFNLTSLSYEIKLSLSTFSFILSRCSDILHKGGDGMFSEQAQRRSLRFSASKGGLCLRIPSDLRWQCTHIIRSMLLNLAPVWLWKGLFSKAVHLSANCIDHSKWLYEASLKIGMGRFLSSNLFPTPPLWIHCVTSEWT
jgi:hypothetical protein